MFEDFEYCDWVYTGYLLAVLLLAVAVLVFEFV
jgi:hypothetical protein